MGTEASLFWEALERVGSLALLAAVLYGGWKFLSIWSDREATRLDNLVGYLQNQLKQQQESFDLTRDSLELMISEVLKILSTIADVFVKHESRDAKRHEQAVVMFKEFSRQTSELDGKRHDELMAALQKLNKRMEALDAKMDG